jgi:hypothetical protein
MSADQDINCYLFGVAICGALIYSIRFILKDLMKNKSLMAVLLRFFKWLGVAVKIVILGGLWLTIPPMILGLTYASIMDSYFQVGNHAGTRIVLTFRNWVLGLILLKVRVRVNVGLV